jgi:hypothetical protein
MVFMNIGNLYTSNFKMKKYVKKLFIFLIPVIIFVSLWEYGLSTIPNTYALKRTQLEAQAGQIKVLVLGPSHALRAVNPSYFRMKGYNVANGGQSLFYDTRIALKYLDKMDSLKVVLIDISYASLWIQLHDLQEKWRDYFYADYWDIRDPKIKWYDLHIYSKILQYGNKIALKYALNGFHVDLTKGYSDNGWAAKTKMLPMNDSAGYTMIKMETKYFSRDNLVDNISYLKSLLSELGKRKIDAVFFTPPETTYYLKYLNKNTLQTIDSVLSGLCNDYHCRRFDYSNDIRFNDSCFSDVGHINEYGAKKFSKIINEEILEKQATLVAK